MSEIAYMRVYGTSVDPREIADLYADARLRRPIFHLSKLQAMYAGSNLVFTAREGNHLVGVCRAITDFAYDTYLCDLAVRRHRQGRGIGRRLMELLYAAAPETNVVLKASHLARNYYAHVGYKKADKAWVYVQRPESRDLVPYLEQNPLWQQHGSASDTEK